jgi:hypothetical protein
MRETFFTDGRNLFDQTGKKVVLRGVNKMSVWDESDPNGDTYFAEIRKTQANTVRIVWAIRKDLKPTGPQTDPDTLDALITNARKYQLIPMIELHDATGQWGRLQELVDYWVQPGVVELIQKHQDYLLVNIGNEVGDDKVKQDQFSSGYKNAVKRMRRAGIHTPLVIDAPDWGKNLDVLNATADKLIQADTDKNLIFSVHLYWSISGGADAGFIQSKLNAAVAHGYPLIVGEFSKYGGFAGNDENGAPRSICGEFGEIDYQTILKVCDEEEIGWYAWEWGPGNDVEDPLCSAMDMTPDGRFDHIKTGWATDVASSIKHASESQNYYRLQPMPEPSALQTSIETLNAVLISQTDHQKVSDALKETNGDWPKALESLTKNNGLKAETIQKLVLAHSLAVWSDDNLSLVKAIANTPNMTDMRDVALNFNADKLVLYVDPKAVPETVSGSNDDEKTKNFAVTLQRKLFELEPTATLSRMVSDAEIPIADASVRAGVATFLNDQPDFNIRATSIYTALQKPDAFKNIADEHRAGVIEQLKTLQRVQALSPVPEAVPALMNANLTSAFQVGEMPESTFLNAYGNTLGDETARQVYTNAINTRIRNEHALMAMRESVRGTGLAIIDGADKMETRMAKMQAMADDQPGQLNLEQLFGSIDFCECGECNSVYSPAAYFVELLQYLRNNNLDPTKPNTGQKGIAGTPLEKLFRRRPDLGCLQLTCENTNTVLPYIDLVNEVMESFVVHLGDYHASASDPKQAKLDVFNVEDETSGELLAQPQHTNYEAYCILKNAVYPFTLPYHQPIDAMRIFLNYLGTSRYELLDRYRAACEICADQPMSADERNELETLHDTTLDRAVDAEFLGLTQEEYIILTKEAFWPRRYFDITLKKNHTDEEYRQNIGVKPVYEYYGYETEADMLSASEAEKKGLTFVKNQFMPRTGILYVDLVELLKAQFINPNFPQGKALTLMESIRFSYRFLQTFVDGGGSDPKTRFAKLIAFLEKTQPLVPMVDAMLHPDPCNEGKVDLCAETGDLRNWVYCYFERVGKLIVLESGEGPRLPIEGRLFTTVNDAQKQIGVLRSDGTIVDDHGAVIGNVTITGEVVGTDGKPFVEKFGSNYIEVRDQDDKTLGFINNQGLWGQRQERLTWLPAQDSCDLDKVRLIHLDGSPVTPEEYDRMQRFIRLWRKLGWTIDETDKALIGLATRHSSAGGGDSDGDCHYTGFEAFDDDCHAGMEGCGGENSDKEDCGCPDFPELSCDITPDFLHQLVAVRKLLDLTGLPLPRLLSFWALISTTGEMSLYSS